MCAPLWWTPTAALGPSAQLDDVALGDVFRLAPAALLRVGVLVVCCAALAVPSSVTPTAVHTPGTLWPTDILPAVTAAEVTRACAPRLPVHPGCRSLVLVRACIGIGCMATLYAAVMDTMVGLGRAISVGVPRWAVGIPRPVFVLIPSSSSLGVAPHWDAAGTVVVYSGVRRAAMAVALGLGPQPDACHALAAPLRTAASGAVIAPRRGG